MASNGSSAASNGGSGADDYWESLLHDAEPDARGGDRHPHHVALVVTTKALALCHPLSLGDAVQATSLAHRVLSAAPTTPRPSRSATPKSLSALF